MRDKQHAVRSNPIAKGFMAGGSITHRAASGRDGTAVALLACIGLALASTVVLLAGSDALLFLRTLSMHGVLLPL